MKKITFLFLTIIYFGTLHAQDSIVNVGVEFKRKYTKHGDLAFFLKADQDYVYAIRSCNNQTGALYGTYFQEYFLIKYDIKNKHSVMWVKSIFKESAADKNAPKLKVLKCYKNESADNELSLIADMYDVKQRKRVIYSVDLNQEGAIVGIPKLMTSFDPRDISSKLNYLEFSEDRKYCLWVNVSDSKQKMGQKFTCFIFDEHKNLVKQRDVSMDINDAKFNVLGFKIANDGEIYLFGTEKRMDEGTKKDRKFYQIYHVPFQSDGGGLVKNEVNLKGDYGHDMVFKVTDDYILCGGYYGEKVSTVTGSFYLKIDRSTNEVEAYVVKPFDELDFEEYMTKEQELTSKTKQEGQMLENLTARQMIAMPDGSTYFVGEVYYTIRTCTDKFCYTSYYYDDIVVTKFTEEGEVEWVKRIPKQQFATSTLTLGYVVYPIGNQLVFIYNDRAHNLNETRPSKLKTYEGWANDLIVTAATLQPNGTLKRKAIFKDTNHVNVIGTEVHLQNGVAAYFLSFSGYTKIERIFEIPNSIH